MIHLDASRGVRLDENSMVIMWQNQYKKGAGMSELQQLRADLAVLQRYEFKNHGLTDAVCSVQERIARLEAAEAETDPWREAKETIGAIENPASSCPEWQKKLASYVRHLEARVAELEARPVPPLNPRRVYATYWHMRGAVEWADVEPYPLET
jgi:hypothetical protein